MSITFHSLKQQCHKVGKNMRPKLSAVSLTEPYLQHSIGVDSLKFWEGAKCLTLGEQHFGRRFSKHKMTRYAKNLEDHCPLTPVAAWRWRHMKINGHR